MSAEYRARYRQTNRLARRTPATTRPRPTIPASGQRRVTSKNQDASLKDPGELSRAANKGVPGPGTRLNEARQRQL